jgi:hypothetical protein
MPDAQINAETASNVRKAINDLKYRISNLYNHIDGNNEEEKNSFNEKRKLLAEEVKRIQKDQNDLETELNNEKNLNENKLNQLNQGAVLLKKEIEEFEKKIATKSHEKENEIKNNNNPETSKSEDLSLEFVDNKNKANPEDSDLSMVIKDKDGNVKLEINGDELYKALDLKTSQHTDFFKKEDRDFMKVVEGLLPTSIGGKPEWGALTIAAPIVVFNMLMNTMICVLANLETLNIERDEKRKKLTEECKNLSQTEMEGRMGNDMLTSWALTPSRSKEEVDMKLGILKNQGFHINESIQEKMRNVPNSPLVTMAGGIPGGLLYSAGNASYENGDKLMDLKARMEGYKKNPNYKVAQENINKNLAHIMKDKTPLPQIKESMDKIDELMNPWQAAQDKIENEKFNTEAKKSIQQNPDENKPIKSKESINNPAKPSDIPNDVQKEKISQENPLEQKPINQIESGNEKALNELTGGGFAAKEKMRQQQNTSNEQTR